MHLSGLSGTHMERITKRGDSSTATGFRNSVRSRIFGHSKPQFLIGGLISVPDHLRKLDEQAFTPQLISIGPIHSSNAKLQNMKECKIQFLRHCIQPVDYDRLELKIREKVDQIRVYYAGTIVSSINNDDFVTMILLDGIFILMYICGRLYLSQNDPMGVLAEWIRPMYVIEEWMHPVLKDDLVLLENQLPFFVLEMLFEEANIQGTCSRLEGKTVLLKELAFKFFHCYNFQNVAFKKFDGVMEHFTDLVRFFYLSEKLPERKSGQAKLSYSATQLQEAGVKFKGVEYDEEMVCYTGHREFLDIRFDSENGVLEIPCIRLNGQLVRRIRNLIALEQSLHVGHTYVTDFFVILDFLIDTSKDVDLLCDKGILVNYLGSSNAAASVVNNLNTNILLDYMNSNYLKICEDLNAFYKIRWHKWRATLWRQYFSTPWRAFSTSAAIVLLLLTAIQTACSLKSITR